MHRDRAVAQPQPEGDLLGGQAVDQGLQHLLLARAQRRIEGGGVGGAARQQHHQPILTDGLQRRARRREGIIGRGRAPLARLGSRRQGLGRQRAVEQDQRLVIG